MNGTDPLAQLRDIHLPEPIGWWPPAPGWWLAAIAGLILIVVLVRFVYRWFEKRRYRREAMSMLKEIVADSGNVDDRQFIEQLNILLRRVAVHVYGREKVAGLVGRKWLEFLDDKAKTNRFTSGEGAVLAEGHYQPAINVDRDPLIQLVGKWLGRRHPC